MAPRVFELRAKRIVAGAPGDQVIHLFDGLPCMDQISGNDSHTQETASMPGYVRGMKSFSGIKESSFRTDIRCWRNALIKSSMFALWSVWPARASLCIPICDDVSDRIGVA